MTIRESTSSDEEKELKSSGSSATHPYNAAKLYDNYTFEGYETFLGVLNKTVTMLGMPMEVPSAKVPVIDSLEINGTEICQGLQDEKNITYVFQKEKADKIYRQISDLMYSIHENQDCGRRKLQNFTDLIALPSKKSIAGHWPWHAALYRINQTITTFICGGTLISKFLVLTAAHCVAEKEVPVDEETLNVVLGIVNLFSGGEDKKIKKIIIHSDYNNEEKINDIALLRLRSRVIYTNDIQPACLWKPELLEKFPSRMTGTVAGWGLNEQNVIPDDLHEAILPKIPNDKCVENNDALKEKLNANNFCAGYRNGTSACNGDSGGGYHVFLPDAPGDPSQKSGRWFVHGIVSASLAVDGGTCDTHNYGLFTNVGNFIDWINEYL